MKNKIIDNIIIFGPGAFLLLVALLPEPAAAALLRIAIRVFVFCLLAGLGIGFLCGVLGLLFQK